MGWDCLIPLPPFLVYAFIGGLFLFCALFSFMLAALEGYTDAVFRLLASRHGVDLGFSEMTHVEALLRGNRDSVEKLGSLGAPFQVQLLTSGEEKFERFLGGFVAPDGFRGFNLNLSCPSKEVIRRGKGAAMVKRAAKTQRLVELIRDHGFPVSVKIRLGLNQFEKDNKLYLNSLGGVNPDFFIVHLKHAGQGSSEAEDYSVFPECVEAARGIPVIANGGIDSVEKVRMLREMGAGGVMIGRAALFNPGIFDELKNELGYNSPLHRVSSLDELRAEYRAIYDEYGGQRRYLDDFMRIVGKKGVRY